MDLNGFKEREDTVETIYRVFEKENSLSLSMLQFYWFYSIKNIIKPFLIHSAFDPTVRECEKINQKLM